MQQPDPVWWNWGLWPFKGLGKVTQCVTSIFHKLLTYRDSLNISSGYKQPRDCLKPWQRPVLASFVYVLYNVSQLQQVTSVVQRWQQHTHKQNPEHVKHEGKETGAVVPKTGLGLTYSDSYPVVTLCGLENISQAKRIYVFPQSPSKNLSANRYLGCVTCHTGRGCEVPCKSTGAEPLMWGWTGSAE